PPKRWSSLSLSFWFFVLLLVVSLFQVDWPDRSVNIWQQALRFFGAFFPPDLSILPQVLRALWETVQIATIATAAGALLSFGFALLASKGVAPGGLVIPTRMALNAIRTLPSLLWALFAVALMGANTLAGIAALTFYAAGYLGKFFSETFEAADFRAARSLRRAGASRWQAMQYGLWPSLRPQLWSQILWMLEYNIRSASIIGYVGAGGIGLQLLRYQEFGQWDRFATVLICIFAVVVGLDVLSSRIRRRLTEESRR
ncbi:MAG: phosphonate ABC transporter, permease protein PhnE, partial [Cyanothece sp. SIO2G6]|nr:phosphonate ABC transporter, permease protein PhnE [Cyanothece sp. SIO2G6]